MPTFEEAFKTYQDSGRGKTVSGMYDAQTNAGLSSLKSTYEQNLSDAQAARGNIDVAYRSNANNLGAQYERMRRNNNIQAAANGLNTGTRCSLHSPAHISATTATSWASMVVMFPSLSVVWRI